MNNATPFSFKRFIISFLGYFIIFSIIIGIFYFANPKMLAYDFLFAGSALTAFILAIYRAKYENLSDIDKAINEDIAHVEEEIKEEVEKISEKFYK